LRRKAENMIIQKAITNIRRIRMECGMSLEDLAVRSGVSYSGLAKLERGDQDINQVSALAVYKLARTLGVSMEDLLEL